MEANAMKITLEPTTKIVDVVSDGAGKPFRARVWEGTTDDGTRVTAVIVRIAAPRDADNRALEQQLVEQRPPSVELNCWPARLVL
jgi:hypothetical protein